MPLSRTPHWSFLAVFAILLLTSISSTSALNLNNGFCTFSDLSNSRTGPYNCEYEMHLFGADPDKFVNLVTCQKTLHGDSFHIYGAFGSELYNPLTDTIKIYATFSIIWYVPTTAAAVVCYPPFVFDATPIPYIVSASIPGETAQVMSPSGADATKYKMLYNQLMLPSNPLFLAATSVTLDETTQTVTLSISGLNIVANQFQFTVAIPDYPATEAIFLNSFNNQLNVDTSSFGDTILAVTDKAMTFSFPPNSQALAVRTAGPITITLTVQDANPSTLTALTFLLENAHLSSNPDEAIKPQYVQVTSSSITGPLITIEEPGEIQPIPGMTLNMRFDMPSHLNLGQVVMSQAFSRPDLGDYLDNLVVGMYSTPSANSGRVIPLSGDSGYFANLDTKLATAESNLSEGKFYATLLLNGLTQLRNGTSNSINYFTKYIAKTTSPNGETRMFYFDQKNIIPSNINYPTNTAAIVSDKHLITTNKRILRDIYVKYNSYGIFLSHQIIRITAPNSSDSLSESTISVTIKSSSMLPGAEMCYTQSIADDMVGVAQSDGSIISQCLKMHVNLSCALVIIIDPPDGSYTYDCSWATFNQENNSWEVMQKNVIFYNDFELDIIVTNQPQWNAPLGFKTIKVEVIDQPIIDVKVSGSNSIIEVSSLSLNDPLPLSQNFIDPDLITGSTFTLDSSDPESTPYNIKAGIFTTPLASFWPSSASGVDGSVDFHFRFPFGLIPSFCQFSITLDNGTPITASASLKREIHPTDPLLSYITLTTGMVASHSSSFDLQCRFDDNKVNNLPVEANNFELWVENSSPIRIPFTVAQSDTYAFKLAYTTTPTPTSKSGEFASITRSSQTSFDDRFILPGSLFGLTLKLSAPDISGFQANWGNYRDLLVTLHVAQIMGDIIIYNGSSASNPILIPFEQLVTTGTVTHTIESDTSSDMKEAYSDIAIFIVFLDPTTQEKVFQQRSSIFSSQEAICPTLCNNPQVCQPFSATCQCVELGVTGIQCDEIDFVKISAVSRDTLTPPTTLVMPFTQMPHTSPPSPNTSTLTDTLNNLELSINANFSAILAQNQQASNYLLNVKLARYTNSATIASYTVLFNAARDDSTETTFRKLSVSDLTTNGPFNFAINGFNGQYKDLFFIIDFCEPLLPTSTANSLDCPIIHSLRSDLFYTREPTCPGDGRCSDVGDCVDGQCVCPTDLFSGGECQDFYCNRCVKMGLNTKSCELVNNIPKCLCNNGYTGSSCEWEDKCVKISIRQCGGNGILIDVNSDSSLSKTILPTDTSVSTTAGTETSCVDPNKPTAKCACLDHWEGTSCNRCSLLCGKGISNARCTGCLCPLGYTSKSITQAPLSCECQATSSEINVPTYSPQVLNYFEMLQRKNITKNQQHLQQFHAQPSSIYMLLPLPLVTQDDIDIIEEYLGAIKAIKASLSHYTQISENGIQLNLQPSAIEKKSTIIPISFMFNCPTDSPIVDLIKLTNNWSSYNDNFKNIAIEYDFYSIFYFDDENNHYNPLDDIDSGPLTPIPETKDENNPSSDHNLSLLLISPSHFSYAIIIEMNNQNLHKYYENITKLFPTNPHF